MAGVDSPVAGMDAWQRTRLGEARVGRLATVRADGRPHVVPVTFALVPGEYADALVTAVDTKPKRTMDLQRLRNIAAQPCVSLLVDHYDDDWSLLWWIRLDCAAQVISDEPRRGDLVVPLVEKYEQYREQPPEGPVIRLDVHTVASWRPGACS